jgi:tetratricopeptide (TPR) repeat protein
MTRARIELHARRAADVAALRILRDALLAAGEAPETTWAPELGAVEGFAPGPIPCALRVVVSGPGGVPAQDADKLAAIVDAPLGASEPLAEDVRAADLVLVPGASSAARLEGLPGQAAVCGLLRLDASLSTPDPARERARETLGIPPTATLLVWRDATPTPVFAEMPARLARQGWIVALLPSSGSGDATLRARAARAPGLALLEETDAADAMAAADLLITADASAFWEALACGRPALHLDCGAAPAIGAGDARLGPGDDPVAIVQRALAGQDAALLARANEHVHREPGCAARMCERLLALLPEPDARATGDEAVFQEVEARAAFGDFIGAAARLSAHLARRASARGFRLLASIQRRGGAPEAAESAAARGEQEARDELARCLCERARTALDRGDNARARGCFDEAHRLGTAIADPLIGLGSLDLHSGAADRAEAHFRSALERERSPRAWSGLGLALAAQGRPTEALAPLEAALDLDAECLPAVYGIVKAAFDTGELSAAERRVRVFVERHPGNLDLAFTLAGLRHQLGDRDGALEMVERIALFDSVYPGLADLRAKLQP